jgi:hypothetical protein
MPAHIVPELRIGTTMLRNISVFVADTPFSVLGLGTMLQGFDNVTFEKDEVTFNGHGSSGCRGDQLALAGPVNGSGAGLVVQTQVGSQVGSLFIDTGSSDSVIRYIGNLSSVPGEALTEQSNGVGSATQVNFKWGTEVVHGQTFQARFLPGFGRFSPTALGIGVLGVGPLTLDFKHALASVPGHA